VALALFALACRSDDRLPAERADMTPNLFGALLGKTDAEVQSKIDTAVRRFFGIGTGESASLIAARGYRCYYELPQDPSLAFIWAPDSNDIRSEGMSYGMMIALQAGLREQFDRLWNFSKKYMQYPPDSELGAWRNYFKWQGAVDTSNAEAWVIVYEPATGVAPDGDEYFAAALYLAHRRWGSHGSVDYLGEANRIASSMLHNGPTARQGPDGVDLFPIIHATQQMVTFAPAGSAHDFSNPSYHVPAFYELFARDGPPEDRAAWKRIAEKSREFLVLAAHPETGLHPDYASFEGAPVQGMERQMHEHFRHDAWRVVMNMAVDYAWFSRDLRMRLQTEKYHAFFSTRLSDDNVDNHSFALDGSRATGGGSTALTATLAAGALASHRSDRARFVRNLWKVEQQKGLYRYYQEVVYLLGLLLAAGQFEHTWD
jgi:oligosaccharide reducing-end xylanase